jgi:hypothetical protein
MATDAAFAAVPKLMHRGLMIKQGEVRCFRAIGLLKESERERETTHGSRQLAHPAALLLPSPPSLLALCVLFLSASVSKELEAAVF